MFDVFSVKRMYNIKVSTGKNTWFLVKIDDGDGGGGNGDDDCDGAGGGGNDDDDDDDCVSGSTIISSDWQTEAVCS